MNTICQDGLLDNDLCDGIAERLEIMIRDARYGDGRIMDLIGLTVDAELRRLITPAVVRTRTRERARSVLAVTLRLDVLKIREVRNLVDRAVTAFTPADRNATVTMLKVVALKWSKLLINRASSAVA